VDTIAGAVGAEAREEILSSPNAQADMWGEKKLAKPGEIGRGRNRGDNGTSRVEVATLPPTSRVA